MIVIRGVGGELLESIHTEYTIGCLYTKYLGMIYKIDPQTISPYLKDASNFSGGSASKIIIPESSDELITFLKNNE